jgi:hypothetical protein
MRFPGLVLKVKNPTGAGRLLVGGDALKTTLLRLLSAAMGLLAALVAIVGPLDFILNQIQERQSAHQYNGHASFWGVVGGSATMLFFVLFFAFVAYFLLRFSFKGPKSGRLPPPNALSG